MDEFLRKVWTTKGARFNAYRRCQRRHSRSVLATSLLSIYVLGLAILPAFVSVDELPVRPSLLQLVTGVLAMIILIITLLEHSRSYQLTGDRLHRSGLMLGELYDQLSARAASGDAQALDDALELGQKKYHEILREINENHTPGDHDLFKAQHRDDFDVSKWTAFLIRTREWLFTEGWYWVAILGPPLLVTIIVVGT